jgi:choline transport protein
MTSLAEYCSIWPTAGGQQYYTQALATGRSRPFLSYLVGWAIMVGEISTGSSCALNSAQIIASFVQIAHPNIEWKVRGDLIRNFSYNSNLKVEVLDDLATLYWTSHWSGDHELKSKVNPFSFFKALSSRKLTDTNFRWLPGVNLFGAIWVVGGGVAWAIVFIVMAPKHDAKVIFTEFLNNTGYENTGRVFIMSFYNSIYGLVGTDGMMHLVSTRRRKAGSIARMEFNGEQVEEMKNPAKNAPVRFRPTTITT